MCSSSGVGGLFDLIGQLPLGCRSNGGCGGFCSVAASIFELLRRRCRILVFRRFPFGGTSYVRSVGMLLHPGLRLFRWPCSLFSMQSFRGVVLIRLILMLGFCCCMLRSIMFGMRDIVRGFRSVAVARRVVLLVSIVVLAVCFRLRIGLADFVGLNLFVSCGGLSLAVCRL